MLKKLRKRYVTISMTIICSLFVLFYVVTGSLFLATLVIDMRSVLQSYSENALSSIASPEIGKSDENQSKWTLLSGSVCVVEVREFNTVTVLI